MNIVELTTAIESCWASGHWCFDRPETLGLRFHTDQRFDVDQLSQNGYLRNQVIEQLTKVILEANPDYLIDCTGFPAHWMTYVAEKLADILGRTVYVIDRWDIDNFKNESGRAIVFVDVFTFGVEASWGLQAARKVGLEPSAVVTIMDRSLNNTFEWGQNEEDPVRLSVGAIFRRRTNLWPERDCPTCRDGIKPFDDYLVLG